MTTRRPNATTINKQALCSALNHNYGISADKLVELRTVLGIYATDGTRYIWKCVTDDSSQVQRLSVYTAVASYLEQFGLTIPQPILTKSQELLLRVENRLGYLQPWLEGQHVNILNREERLQTAATIGWYHYCMTSLPLIHTPELFRGSLQSKFAMKQALLHRLWADICQRCPDFRHVEASVFQLTERAVQAAKHPHPLQYCHRDTAPHNFLRQESGRIVIIDFDESGLDHPQLDILQFTNHGIYLGALKPGYYTEIVTAYANNHPLSDRQTEALWALLAFPDQLFRSVAEWMRHGWDDLGKRNVARWIQTEQVRRRILEADYVDFRDKKFRAL